MTLLELRSKFLLDLKEFYPKTEILSFYFLLIEHHLGIKKSRYFLIPRKEIKGKTKRCFIIGATTFKKRRTDTIYNR